MLKTIITGALALTTAGVGASAIVSSPTPAYLSPTSLNSTIDTTITYSLEQMLNLAIQDEYLAKATYTKLFEAYPDQKMLERLIAAEQRHIDLLIPLFETYQLEVPSDPNTNLVLSYQSFAEAAKAIATGELVNIEMYQHFLSTPDLAVDVADVFKKLLSASTMHLQAAQKVAFDLPHQNRSFNRFINRRRAVRNHRMIQESPEDTGTNE